jgi:probable rRNA maturation factor
MTADRPMRPAIDIQIAVECDGWPVERLLENFCNDIIRVATDYLAANEGQPFPQTGSELSLLFTDDASVQDVNGRWRDQDKPTNVLSFPAFPVSPGQMPGPMLGDILFALETISREAVSLEIPFDSHLTHLLVHGFLHLLGYDHANERDAETMEGLETRILATLDLSDPYENTDPV